jgi:hypothetical protein
MLVARFASAFLALLARGTSFEIIGAGLRHTGCDELAAALNILGFNTYHSGKELPSTHPEWVQVMKAAEKSQEGMDIRAALKASDLKSLYKFAGELVREGHRAIVSSPAAFYALELLRKYPKAKVILTVQESSSKWFYEMMKGTQIALHRDMVQAEYHRMSRCPLPPADADLNECTEEYDSHNAAVRSTVPLKQFLEFSPKDGWGPLCKFLGVPIPQVPFPGEKKNSGLSAVALWIAFAVVLLVGTLIAALTMFAPESPKKPSKKKA